MTEAETTDDEIARMRAELALLRELTDCVPGMLAYWGRDGVCRYANRAYETWFGLTPESVVGHTYAGVLGPELYRLNLPHFEAVLRGEEQRFVREIPDPAGGPPRLSQAHYVPHVERGQVLGFYVLVADITDHAHADQALRDAERRLQAAERLASMATLTHGIAHEINNPLAISLLGLDDAIEQLEHAGPSLDPVAMRDSLVSAREGMQRVVSIVQSMKLLGHLDTTVREQVSVKASLEQSMALATTEIRYRARLQSDVAEVGVIDGNEAQLSQVFTCLLLNVAQALPEGSSERNEIHVATRRDGAHIVIDIADNGRAARTQSSELVAQRAFDRFFAKPDPSASMGLGLGLSVARDIVTALGGSITAEPRTGNGTLVRVTLPASAEQLPLPASMSSGAQRTPSDVPAPSSVERGVAARARVLVVDDEVLVGRSLKRHLGINYDVDSVTSGREAIDRIIAGRYDVILCDLMMPDVSGPDVHAAVVAARPDLAPRFIFMTGGAFTPRGREFLSAVASVSATVLDKPFDMPALDAAVLRVASASRSAATASTSSASTTPTAGARRRPGARD